MLLLFDSVEESLIIIDIDSMMPFYAVEMFVQYFSEQIYNGAPQVPSLGFRLVFYVNQNTNG